MSRFLHKDNVLTWRVHVMSAGLGLCLRLGLSHHWGAKWVHHSWLAGPRGGLRNVSRGPWGGAWAARVKGWRAAMETSPAVSTTPNTAAAQVHRQSLLCKEGRCYRKRRRTSFSCGILNESSFEIAIPELKQSHTQSHTQLHHYKEIFFSLWDFYFWVKRIYRRNLWVFSLNAGLRQKAWVVTSVGQRERKGGMVNSEASVSIVWTYCDTILNTLFIYTSYLKDFFQLLLVIDLVIMCYTFNMLTTSSPWNQYVNNNPLCQENKAEL